MTVLITYINNLHNVNICKLKKKIRNALCCATIYVYKILVVTYLKNTLVYYIIVTL